MCSQAKYIAQIVVAGVQIVGRAFVKAVQTEMRASQQAAQARSSGGKKNIRSAAADALTGMTLQVFNVTKCFLPYFIFTASGFTMWLHRFCLTETHKTQI